MLVVPHAPLRISPRSIAALAAAAIGATLGHPVASIVFAQELKHRVPPAFVALTTGLLCMLVVLRAAGRKTRVAVGVSAALWSIVAGGVNAGLAAQCQAWHRVGEDGLAPFVLASAFGLVIASPLSAGFALVNAALAIGAREATVSHSHEALDRMLGHAGLTVAAVGALRLAATPDVWALVPVTLGALAATSGFGRSRARRVWLRAVDRGEVPGLRIELPEGDVDAALPCLLGHADAADSVLVRASDDDAHYRCARPDRHLARIDLFGP